MTALAEPQLCNMVLEMIDRPVNCVLERPLGMHVCIIQLFNHHLTYVCILN